MQVTFGLMLWNDDYGLIAILLIAIAYDKNKQTKINQKLSSEAQSRKIIIEPKNCAYNTLSTKNDQFELIRKIKWESKRKIINESIRLEIVIDFSKNEWLAPLRYWRRMNQIYVCIYV